MLPCVQHGGVYIPNFHARQPAGSSPFFFESAWRFKIYLPHFTMRKTRGSLAPKFHRVTIRRHFAVSIAIRMPFCNLSSEFYHAYDLVRFISQMSLRDSPESVRRFSSDLPAVFKFSFRILPCVRQDAFYLPNSTVWQIGASLPVLLLFACHLAIYLPDFTMCATWSVYLPKFTERQFAATLPVYLISDTPFCKLPSKLRRACDTMHYIFRILPCVWLDAVYLLNFPAEQTGGILPFNFESACRFLIRLPHFTVRTTWWSLYSKFPCAPARRQFALFFEAAWRFKIYLPHFTMRKTRGS